MVPRGYEQNLPTECNGPQAGGQGVLHANYIATTLKRRVDGRVPINAKPGPPTILTKEEEEKLCKYCLDMCDMGTLEDERTVAYRIAQNSGRPHLFSY